MVNLGSVVLEAKQNGTESLTKACKKLHNCEEFRYSVALCMANASVADPMLALLGASREHAAAVMSVAALAFESGRLYGRSELIEEMEKK